MLYSRQASCESVSSSGSRSTQFRAASLLSGVLLVVFLQWVILLPLLLPLVLASLLVQQVVLSGRSMYKKAPLPKEVRTVLIKGCEKPESLHLARQLRAAGHRVIACDFSTNLLNPTRFSSSVDTYYTVPNPSRSIQEYVRALCLIAQQEQVTDVIPLSDNEDLKFDLKAKPSLEHQGCRVFLPTEWPGLSTISNNNNCFSAISAKGRKGDRLNEVDTVDVKLASITEYLSQLVSELHTESSGNTFLQDLMHVEKFTSCCLIKANRVVGVASCPVLVEAPSVKWDSINEQVTSFTQLILQHLGSTIDQGVVTWELLVSPEGRVLPVNMYPVVGPAFVHFLDEDFLANCITSKKMDSSVAKLNLKSGGPMRYAFYSEALRLLVSPSWTQCRRILWNLRYNREEFFRFSDPLPFFAYNHLHMPFKKIIHQICGRPVAVPKFLR